MLRILSVSFKTKCRQHIMIFHRLFSILYTKFNLSNNILTSYRINACDDKLRDCFCEACPADYNEQSRKRERLFFLTTVVNNTNPDFIFTIFRKCLKMSILKVAFLAGRHGKIDSVGGGVKSYFTRSPKANIIPLTAEEVLILTSSF